MRPWVLLLLLTGCDTAGTLIVQVRTDLTPVREFDLARVVIEGSALRDVVTPAVDQRAWGQGARVAELTDLAPGSYRLTVRLERADGTVIVSRPARVELAGGLETVTVLLTRDCAGVVCPDDGDPEATACLAGRCVVDECTEEDPGTCDVECASVADCGHLSAPPCGSVECTPSGSCFVSPRHVDCGEGQVCDPRLDACVSEAPTCSRWGPFGEAVPAGPTINTGENEFGPCLSADGLTLYFGRHVDLVPTIFRVRRDSPRGEFGPAELVLDGERWDDPVIAEGGRALIVARNTNEPDASLWISRLDARGRFGPPTPLEFTTYMRQTSAGADVTADGLLLTFTSSPYDASRVVIAERTDPSEPFGVPVPVASLEDFVSRSLGWPGISDDGLELFVEYTIADLDLYRLERSSRTEPFGPPARLDATSFVGREDGDPDISADGSTLWFASRRGGDFDLYYATRTCEAP
ncbi:MAG: hypothetical protein R3B82_21760 [Sandaracinaceae bacterium]